MMAFIAGGGVHSLLVSSMLLSETTSQPKNDNRLDAPKRGSERLGRRTRLIICTQSDFSGSAAGIPRGRHRHKVSQHHGQQKDQSTVDSTLPFNCSYIASMVEYFQYARNLRYRWASDLGFGAEQAGKLVLQ